MRHASGSALVDLLFGNAVTRDRSAEVVQLVHFSVREYLCAAAMPPLIGRCIGVVLLADAKAQHNHMASVALCYLQYQNVWHDGTVVIADKHWSAAIIAQHRPFVSYAAENWSLHAAAGRKSNNNLQAQIIKFFSQGNAKWVLWCEYIERRGDVWSPNPSSPASRLYYAARYGLVGAIDFLISRADVDVNDVGSHYGAALQVASAMSQLDAVMSLLQHGADIDLQAGACGTALNATAHKGHTTIVRFLLEQGANTQLLSPDQYSAMYFACENKNWDIVQLLLKANVSMAVGAKHGWSSLHIATDHGNLEFVEHFLQQGVDESVSSENGCTTLFMACSRGHLDIVQHLLNCGASLSVTASDRQTNLHLACCAGHCAIAKVLLDCRASTTTPKMMTCCHRSIGPQSMVTVP